MTTALTRGASREARIATEEIDAVIFDLDGVVTDTATVHAAAWKLMFDAYLRERSRRTGKPLRSFERDPDYLRHVDGMRRQDGVRSFLASRGISLPEGSPDDPPGRETIHGLGNRKNRLFQEQLRRQGVQPFPSAVALIERLRELGVRTAIISASRNGREVLRAAGVDHLFDARVDGVDADELGLPGKPDPAVFLEAARRLGVAPARAAVVEDSLAGVEAADRGGFALVIGVDRADHGSKLLERGAGVVVPDLAEVRVTNGERRVGEEAGTPSPAELRTDASGKRRPVIAASAGWRLSVEGLDPEKERAREACLTIGDGRIGTGGSPLLRHAAAAPRVFATGVYHGVGPDSELLGCPNWSLLSADLGPGDALRRDLDLQSGVLRQEVQTAGGLLRAEAFSSLARPGTVALRVEGPQDLLQSPALVAPEGHVVQEGQGPLGVWMSVAAAGGGGVSAAATQEHRETQGSIVLERVGAFVGDSFRLPDPSEVSSTLKVAPKAGFERLLAEHREAWDRRWEEADVVVEGDPDLQRALRFALFHLIGSVPDEGEAAVGARGLTGPAYRGHVFWDSDVFVLPFLAATHPAAARAMLEYRIRRLPAARRAAREAGFAGARFPWESARDGGDVTPTSARDASGKLILIRTGDLEEHIVADVAWAAATHIDWTGDRAFAEGPGRELLVETARYWASRIRLDGEGRGHIDGVIGPDEYHEMVDDNAFTNVMARWNLRRAAGTPGIPSGEARRWRELADALVDGWDSETGLYEQFSGFFDLEPLVIARVAPRRPIAADLLLGRERTEGAQIVKQADVLMLHHLVPGEVVPGSLETNLEFYEPRTAHGSSLSPGIHAALLARAGRMREAIQWLRLTAHIDLDDLTGTTGGGLHLATMGSLWQAVVFGFAGVRPDGETLSLDPRLPGGWEALEIPVRFRGSRVRVRIQPGEAHVVADPAVTLRVGERVEQVGSEGVSFELPQPERGERP